MLLRTPAADGHRSSCLHASLTKLLVVTMLLASACVPAAGSKQDNSVCKATCGLECDSGTECEVDFPHPNSVECRCVPTRSSIVAIVAIPLSIIVVCAIAITLFCCHQFRKRRQHATPPMVVMRSVPPAPQVQQHQWNSPTGYGQQQHQYSSGPPHNPVASFCSQGPPRVAYPAASYDPGLRFPPQSYGHQGPPQTQYQPQSYGHQGLPQAPYPPQHSQGGHVPNPKHVV